MRVLLTGKDGQVGTELQRHLARLGDVRACGRSEIDLSQPDLLRADITRYRPQVIVNSAAYTAVDRAESEGRLAMDVNARAPGILAEEARRLGALLIHFSTDYIFDGAKAGAYTEEDEPNPLNIYGVTKMEGEKRITASGCRHMILRTSWVYGPRGQNFFLTVARRALAGQELRVVGDQRGVPSYAAFIAESTRILVERGYEGLLHLCPAGATTWHGFAQGIVDRLGIQQTVTKITTADYPTAARRPANSVLDNRKAASVLGPLPPWETLLDRCVEAWSRQ